MVDFVQNCIDGLTIGSAYALLALGFTLIFGVMRRLNLSYGPSIMAGVFLGVLLYSTYQASGWLVALATVIGAIAVGAYVERLCFWAVRSGAAIASMVSSFAVWMQIEEAVTLGFPQRTYAFPTVFEADAIVLGPFFLRASSLAMFVTAAVAIVALNWLLYRTHFGLSLRAVSEQPQAARVAGVNVARISFIAFCLASALGGLAGFLIVSAEGQVTPLFGLWATFKGLIAMMLGGMGSIAGAVVGGLLLGMVEINAQWYLGAEYRDLVAYLTLFVFLIVRPGGLLAQHAVHERLAADVRV